MAKITVIDRCRECGFYVYSHTYGQGCPLEDAPEKGNDILKAIEAIRKIDTGAWLKECSAVFNCSEGAEERQKIMRALDKLYRVALK